MNANDPDLIYLRDGRLVLQSIDLPLYSQAIDFDRSDKWEFRIEVISGSCQLLLHTWQRMIHEPTYFHDGGNYESATVPYEVATYAGDDLYAATGGNDYSQGNYQTSHTFGANVVLLGNSEFGARRIVYLSCISQMEMSIDSLLLDRVLVRFRCPADLPLESVLHINDGTIT